MPKRGAPAGNTNAVKPAGDTLMFSLSYSREDTALLKCAWEIDSQNDPGALSFEEWVRFWAKSGPIEAAKRLITEQVGE